MKKYLDLIGAPCKCNGITTRIRAVHIYVSKNKTGVRIMLENYYSNGFKSWLSLNDIVLL